MKKIIEKVPKDIRFLGDWKDFCLPDGIAILDKQITGCGFTEYCIKNDEDIILCSPRKILLEDKAQQHIGEVYYIKNEYEKEASIDKDLTAEKPSLQEEDNSKETTNTILDLHKRIELAYEDSKNKEMPCKILVTYDSFRHVKEVFTKLGILEKFRIVVDEFQSIFTDSKFKSTTEIEFLNHLNNLSRVCFVSATPMIEKYLDELDEFKDLPYYELDWESEDPGRVIIPLVNVKQYTKGLTSIVSGIIDSYKNEEFDSAIIEIDGVKTKVESKEAVFYVNSVKNICDIIKKNHLTLENTNILCARTDKNEKALKKAFGVKNSINVFGRVPKRGETHKMFTLCTRTVYLGADFYSTNAKSYIFSDANIDSLAVDITLDLPQILGRQRLVENPWKNRADLYCKLLAKDLQQNPEEFTKYLNNKQKRTEDLLQSYSETSTSSAKHTLAETYQFVAINANYKSDYIAVNTHAGSDLKPVFNKLVMLSEIRSFEIQQVDYKDRFRLFNSLKSSDKVEYDDEVTNIIECLDLLPYFNQKMKYLYDLNMSEDLAKKVFDTLLDTEFSKYYYSISKEKAGTLKYNKKQLEKEYNRVNSISSTINLEKLPEEVYNNFLVGTKYPKSYIKEKLKEIYDKLGYSKTAKANDIEEYFEIKPCQFTNKDTGKRDNGFELIKKLK